MEITPELVTMIAAVLGAGGIGGVIATLIKNRRSAKNAADLASHDHMLTQAQLSQIETDIRAELLDQLNELTRQVLSLSNRVYVLEAKLAEHGIPIPK